MPRPKSFLSQSAKETMALAKEFARKLKPGAVVALTGDLGSGKTTFIKGVALGLGLRDPDRVKSPTFVIMHIYPTKVPLYHFDLYRLESLAEIEAVGFEEFVHDPHAITCVEWAEKAEKLLPRWAQRVQLKITGENERRMVIR